MSTSPQPPQPPSWTPRDERRVLVLLASVASVFVAPLIWRVFNIGGELDWKYFQMLWEADRKSVVEFGQLPLWNPWYCGGNAQLANPQTQFFSIATVFSLFFGAPVGIKLHILLHYVLGMWGAWKLARTHGLQALGGVGAALVFGLSGFFAMRAGGGHSAFLPFFFMPWAAHFYEVGKRNIAGGVGLGLTLALMLLEGGAYAFSLTGGMLAMLAGFDLWTDTSGRRAVLRTAGVAALVLLPAAAVKLVPVLEFTSEFPRTVPVKDTLNFTRVLSMFVGRSMTRHCEGCVYVWPEYINYVGPLVLAVFVLGVGRVADLRWRRAYIVALLAGLIMIGDHGPAAPYVLLHKIPPYDSLRVPARWGIVVVLQMALLFGAFLDALPGWLARRRPSWGVHGPLVATTLLATVALDMALQNGRLWAPGFPEAPRQAQSEPFHQVAGGATSAWFDVRRNVGTLRCYENVQVPTSKALWTGRTEQVRVSGAPGSAKLTHFSPNAWTIDVDVSAPATLLINQNFHRLWRVSNGQGEVANVDGLLAVRVPAGRQQLTVRYAPMAIWPMLVLSLATWIAGAVLLWRRRESWWLAPPSPEPEPEPDAPTTAPVSAATAPPAVPVPIATEVAPVVTVPPTPDLPSALPLPQLLRQTLAAAALAALGFAIVQTLDLALRGVAELRTLPGILIGALLVEAGAVSLLLAAALVPLRLLGWSGHAVGRTFSAPFRWVLAVDDAALAGARAFARLGGALTGSALFIAGLAGLTLWSNKAFNARELAAVLIGVLSLPLATLALAACAAVTAGLTQLASMPLVGAARNVRAAGVLPWVAIAAVVGTAAIGAAAPVLKGTDLRPALYPALTLLGGLALSFLLPRGPWLRGTWWLLILAGSLVGVAAGLPVVTRSTFGAVLMERGQVTGTLVRGIQKLGDRDGDGHSTLLGGRDCDDARADVHPGALDAPANGVDEDCSGADFQPPPRDPNAHRAPLPDGLGPYKNVVFIIVDTLRQDRLHLYGNPRPTTPYLDQLALSSTVFDNAYANGVRSHRSIPSILTGRYPSRLKMEESNSELLTLRSENTTIAERLTPQGYSAAAFILEKYFEGQKGLTQGFDFHNPRRVDPTYRDWSKPQGEAVVNAAMRWITEQQDRPWIVWTHLYDPHLYWHDTPFGSDPLARFDAAVRYVDTHVGRLVEFVKSQPDGDKTLVVITADHGQGLGTHGEYGHGQLLFQEDIRVPMIIHAPGFPAQRINTVVENVDLVPTVLNLLGRSQPLDPTIDGKSLVPLMARGDAAASGDPGTAFVEGLTDKKQPKNRRAVIRGRHKLFIDLDLGTERLFDVEADPMERSDISAEQPDTFKALKEALQTHTALSTYLMR